MFWGPAKEEGLGLCLGRGRSSAFDLTQKSPKKPSYSSSATFPITECPQPRPPGADLAQKCGQSFSGLLSAQNRSMCVLIHTMFLPFPILHTYPSDLVQCSAPAPPPLEGAGAWNPP